MVPYNPSKSPLGLLEGRDTANQYKVVLSGHLYPVMKYFYPPDESGLFQDDSLIHKAQWVTELYAITFTVTRSQTVEYL